MGGNFVFPNPVRSGNVLSPIMKETSPTCVMTPAVKTESLPFASVEANADPGAGAAVCLSAFSPVGFGKNRTAVPFGKPLIVMLPGPSL